MSPEQNREKVRKWYQKNKDRKKEYNKEYYQRRIINEIIGKYYV